LATSISKPPTFFETPKKYDLDAVKPKWTDAKTTFFNALITKYAAMSKKWKGDEIENTFKALAEEQGLKPGDVMLPLRVMLVGGKFGPHVFDIAEILNWDETIYRIERALAVFGH